MNRSSLKTEFEACELKLPQVLPVPAAIAQVLPAGLRAAADVTSSSGLHHDRYLRLHCLPELL